MEIENKIMNLYIDSLDTEKNKLAALYKSDVDNNRVLLSLSSVNISKFEYNFFAQNNLFQSKQVLFTFGKCVEYRFKNFRKSNPIIKGAFYNILSDSTELINSFKKREFNNQDYWIQQGASAIIIQEILKDNLEVALKLLNSFDNLHKNYPLKEKDSAILKAIINKDKMKVEELLELFLLPENHKKINDPLMLSTKLFSLHATGFAKLAYLKGIEVNVEHPLLPKELLPINPNRNYEIEYDFLKPNFKPNVVQKKESSMKKDKSNKGFFGKWFK